MTIVVCQISNISSRLCFEIDCFIDAWVLHCPNAAGRHQSPVEIMSKNCLLKESLLDQEITIMYMDECFNKISNNGHTFVVSCASSESSLCESKQPNSYSNLILIEFKSSSAYI